ncbi:MAG: helix-turn-helix domain-containing protein [Kribbellaceae bacterium]
MPDTTVRDWVKLGATLGAARRRQRISQHELARRAGVSRSWLARVEAGHRGAELEQVLRVLDALGLKLVLRDVDVTAAQSPEPADSLRAGPTVAEAGRAADLALQVRRRSADARRRSWSAAERHRSRSNPESPRGFRRGDADG